LGFPLDTVLFEEELVSETQLSVIADLGPGTKPVTTNANQKHAVFPCTPGTAVVRWFCGFWKAEVLEIGYRRSHPAHKTHVRGSVDNCPGIETLDTLMVEQDSLLFLLGHVFARLLQRIDLLHVFLNERCSFARDFLKGSPNGVSIATL
jgi:hypothetical protein